PPTHIHTLSLHDALPILTELNEELENYFRNTIIPQVFIDAELILRKFTPPAMKQFNLRKEHIGRPISEVVDNFRFSTLIENIKQDRKSTRLNSSHVKISY